MQPISYKRHRFPPEVIRYGVWLYFSFTLSLRDVEQLLAERGVEVSYETVRKWCDKFRAPDRAYLKPLRHSPSRTWHPDDGLFGWRQTRVSLAGGRHRRREVLDMLMQSSRDANAALRLLRRYGSPERIVTDGLRSYGSALRELRLDDRYRPRGSCLNRESRQGFPEAAGCDSLLLAVDHGQGLFE